MLQFVITSLHKYLKATEWNSQHFGKIMKQNTLKMKNEMGVSSPDMTS